MGAVGLRYEIDQFTYDLRNYADAVRECERRHKIELDRLNKSWQEASDKMKKMREALEHAERNRIGVERY